MKKYVLALSLVFVSSFAMANEINQCGLIDSADDLEEIEGSRVNLEIGMTGLTKTEKQQIIIGTKELLAGSGEDYKIPRTTDQAIDALIDYGYEGNLSKIVVNGKVFDRLLSYPGDNAYGVIFAEGSLKVIALVQDSDVVCK